MCITNKSICTLINDNEKTTGIIFLCCQQDHCSDGARNTDILVQFLVKAVVLALIGCIIEILSGCKRCSSQPLMLSPLSSIKIFVGLAVPRNHPYVSSTIGIAYAISSSISIKMKLNQAFMAVSLGFSGFVGLFFGFYPDRKAPPPLRPIESLRFEQAMVP